jgi:AraC family transcriptional regulator
MENLQRSLTLEQMASVAQLSPYHFARQFKATTRMTPYQYVIERRVERAQQLLRINGELSLAEVAARTGFSDQSQFTSLFKRIVGITISGFRRNLIEDRKGAGILPRPFHTPARIS